MTKELSDILKYLRLGNLLLHWEDYLKLAADRKLGRLDFENLRTQVVAV